MEPVRLPLTSSIESRDSTTNKDSLTKNCLFEPSSDGTTNVVKRPGLDLHISALGGGNGLFFYNNILYSFNDLNLGTFNIDLSLSNGTKWLSSAEVNPTDNYIFKATINPILPYVTKYDVATQTDYSNLTPICWTGSKFLLYNNTAQKLLSSTDGDTWTVSNLTTTSTVASGVVGGSTILLLGTNPLIVIAKSTNNGVSWTTIGTTLTNQRQVAANATTFTTGSTYSSDGVTWNACTGGITEMTGLCWTGNKFIGFNQANNSQVYTSSDGITWTNSVVSGAPTTSGDRHSAGINNVIVSTNATYGISTTSDGTNWTYQGVLNTGFSYTSNQNNNITVLGTSFAMPIQKSTSPYTRYLLTSIDVTTWTQNDISSGRGAFTI